MKKSDLEKIDLEKIFQDLFEKSIEFVFRKFDVTLLRQKRGDLNRGEQFLKLKNNWLNMSLLFTFYFNRLIFFTE